MRFLFIVIAFAKLCIGVTWAATCANGWYMNSDTCAQCPQYYPNSVPDALSINDCYLITNPGEYVAAAGMTPVLCPINHYCPGNVPVFYDLELRRYINVDYIAGTGTQYIDTGIILGSDIDTEMVFESGPDYRVDAALFGAVDNDLHYWLNGWGNDVYIRYNDYHPTGIWVGHITENKKTVLEVKHGNWMLDDKIVYANNGAFDVGITGYLFALNAGGDARWIHQRLKIFSFKQWRNGDLVLDLMPVYDLQTGQYGMWDNVGNRFLGNVGTGEFVGSPYLTGFSKDGSIDCAVATDNTAPYSPLGADDIVDCGYVMHIGKNRKLYLHSEKRTSPSFAAQIKNRIFYADISPEKHGILRVNYNGQILSIYNMDADD